MTMLSLKLTAAGTVPMRTERGNRCFLTNVRDPQISASGTTIAAGENINVVGIVRGRLGTLPNANVLERAARIELPGTLLARSDWHHVTLHLS